MELIQVPSLPNWLLHPAILYAVALVGMIVHFLKQKVKGQTLVEIREYFSANFKDTLIAFIATSLGFVAYMFGLSTGQNADFLAVFAVGYMCDSFFNKWDKT